LKKPVDVRSRIAHPNKPHANSIHRGTTAASVLSVHYPEFHPLFEFLGYLAGYLLYRRNRNRHGDALSPGLRWNLIAAATFGGLIGARALGLAEESPSMLLSLHAWLTPGGKTIVGGLLGGWLAVEVAKEKLRVPTRTGDLLAIPLCIGIAIGRIGCFLAGMADDTYGKPTSLPWGVNFGDGIPRHPTQIYELLFLLLLAWWLHRKSSQPHPDGHIFRIFLAAYLGWRLLIDFLKPQPLFAGMNMIQWACLAGLLILFASRQRKNREPAYV
jgi:prolipoprotein diacylglyceryltransferase